MIPTRDKITVTHTNGHDDWGRPLPTTVQTYSARVDMTVTRFVDKNGQDATSKAIIFVKGFAPIKETDTISWTDAFGTHTEQPKQVSPLKDISNKMIFTKVVI